MTRKDYIKLAEIVGNTLSCVQWHGGTDARDQILNVLYKPLVTMLADDNPRFSQMRFLEAVAKAEQEANQ